MGGGEFESRLKKIIVEYNQTYHSTIKCALIEA